MGEIQRCGNIRVYFFFIQVLRNRFLLGTYPHLTLLCSSPLPIRELCGWIKELWAPSAEGERKREKKEAFISHCSLSANDGDESTLIKPRYPNVFIRERNRIKPTLKSITSPLFFSSVSPALLCPCRRQHKVEKNIHRRSSFISLGHVELWDCAVLSDNLLCLFSFTPTCFPPLVLASF